MVEMKVFGLALDEDSQVPVLILKNLDETQTLPIWIGAMEAMAISMAINEVKLPRPMTHDLMLNMISSLGGVVRYVDVTELREGTYYAEIEIVQGERIERVDSRPSDAIAVALRAGAPIRVHEDVLAKASIDEKIMPKTMTTGEDSDKWSELLEGLNPEDIKYKM